MKRVPKSGRRAGPPPPQPAAAPMPPVALPFLPGLTASFIRQYGKPLIATLPQVFPDGDHAQAFNDLLTTIDGAEVVLFPDIWPGDLDGFFHLRLAQILCDQPPSPALSVVVLAAELSGRPLAGGFADRFCTAWPFARCVFVTDSDDNAALSTQLGVPVGRLDAEQRPPTLRTDARAGQPIALQLQMPWGRCGSTTLFENQIESLVRAGYLTVRLYSDARLRRGPTLTTLLDQIIPENSTHAGAHIDGVAVPFGPPAYRLGDQTDQDWATWLAATALCRIRDPVTVQAAARADVVVANGIDAIGTAVHLAPAARLLLDVQTDRAAAAREFLLENGVPAARADAAVASTVRAQAGVLAIPDICVHLSTTDMVRLTPQSRSAIVLPRIYTHPAPYAGPARFDVLVVGDENAANIASLRWFLDEVWRPHLEPASLRVAVVGRAGQRIDASAYASPALFILGFVDDLDTFRSWCRLTAVPDRGGTGISIKTLTTMGAEHPLVTTSGGLRGLDPAIAGLLPAQDDPAAFAAEIIALLRDPEQLAGRQRLVSQAQEAIKLGATYADVVRSIPPADDHVVQDRQAKWAQVVAAAPPPDPASYSFALDTDFPMSGVPADPSVLGEGWHEPESWGRWTDGAEATLRLTLAAPPTELLGLELDINPSPVGALLTLNIDDTAFPPINPAPGPNTWNIPPEAIEGKTSVLVTLRVSEAVCPAKVTDSPDTRILGIGVSAIRLRSRQPTIYKLGEYLPINRDTHLREVLLTGWHQIEPWGCWSSNRVASLALRFDEPLRDNMRLELDIAPTPEHPALTLSVNEWIAPPRVSPPGTNRWDLPLAETQNRTSLTVTLSVAKTYGPSEVAGSIDDRILGVGLRGVRLRPFEPVVVAVGTPVRPNTQTELDGILLRGWHKPEAWGCWTSGSEAELRLAFVEPLTGSFRLELDLSLPSVHPELTVVANGHPLPPILPVIGRNVWILPDHAINGKKDILIELRVSTTICPAEHDGPVDDRTLGIGVRSISLHREAASVCRVGTIARISSDIGDTGILLAGWHKPERWGCWTAGREASMRLSFDNPLQGRYGLRMDMVPPLKDMDVTLAVNDTVLQPLYILEGLNEWTLPLECTEGQTILTLRLIVEHPVRPVDVTSSSDDRVLGVAIKALLVRPL